MEKQPFEEIMKRKNNHPLDSIDVRESVMVRIENHEQKKAKMRRYLFLITSFMTLTCSLITIFLLEGIHIQYQLMAEIFHFNSAILKTISQVLFATIFILTIALIAARLQPIKSRQTIHYSI